MGVSFTHFSNIDRFPTAQHNAAMKKTLAVILTLFCVPAFSIEPASPASISPGLVLPDTNPARLLKGWLHVCETPQLADTTTWFTANLSESSAKRLPAAERAKNAFDICNLNGGLRAVEVTQSDAHQITAKAVGIKLGLWYDIIVIADDAGKYDRGTAQPATPAESALSKDLSDQAIAQDLARTIATLGQAGLFSGIVTVARGDHVIASASAGYADRANKTPITGDTQFTLASLGKMFTAAGIAQLVDQKKTAFDDKVGKFFPDYPNRTVRDQVTVGMLLSHTSGMGEFLDKRAPDMMQHGIKRAAEFMPLYDNDELKFAPGARWDYSNAGLALVGAILEQASGEDYPDYLRQHVFAPAGMTGSDPNNIPYRNARLVTPYTKYSEQGPTPDWQEAEHDIGSPGGGAVSTANDLVRFADALRNGKLVSKTTFDIMAQSHAKPIGGGGYGYAMNIMDVYGRTVVGHGGGFPGVATRLYMVLGSPYTVVVLANQDFPADLYAGMKVLGMVVEKAKLESK
jgi:CubicO group peptidase (beta-lactamase class C family)